MANLTITTTDVLEGNLISVALSNGTTVQVTLDQIMGLHPVRQSEDEVTGQPAILS